MMVADAKAGATRGSAVFFGRFSSGAAAAIAAAFLLIGCDEGPSQPPEQQSFLEGVGATRDAYMNATSDAQKKAALEARESWVASHLDNGEFRAWTADVYALEQHEDGTRDLTLQIGDRVWLETKGKEADGKAAGTGIPAKGALADKVATLIPKERVMVWGRVLKERSVSEIGRMREPEYLTLIYWVSSGDDAPLSEVAFEKARDNADRRVAAARKELARKQAACRQDLQCWGKQNKPDAESACAPEIEKLAKYDFKWTNGWLESRFTKIAWADKEKGTLNFYGDAIQLQNGLGAWIRHSYACTFDPATRAVLDVRGAPGRF